VDGRDKPGHDASLLSATRVSLIRYAERAARAHKKRNARAPRRDPAKAADVAERRRGRS
jgi:hypothetical protein